LKSLNRLGVRRVTTFQDSHYPEIIPGLSKRLYNMAERTYSEGLIMPHWHVICGDEESMPRFKAIWDEVIATTSPMLPTPYDGELYNFDAFMHTCIVPHTPISMPTTYHVDPYNMTLWVEKHHNVLDRLTLLDKAIQYYINRDYFSDTQLRSLLVQYHIWAKDTLSEQSTTLYLSMLHFVRYTLYDYFDL
jgi:hypothetical protein